ncbi:hypothetical protein BD626DRAFT_578238 [Schizophyllum amplum]|uniref:Zn(2)-C6 fungal-type domain-containing protein n=1 Tax=Schizophyllum amplum TaxID=97359 RepID=A0A550BS23_9AGAR|nr:hypothetical protein BD626DRAFT_578238 [Auriculariopsis ampla]
MNVHDDRADDAQNHKKKRVCDYCKAKRVICHPQPDAKPCPRCLEKGIHCTTTIHPRKARGTGAKALANKARQEAASESSSSSSPGPAPNACHSLVLPSVASAHELIPGNLIQDALEIIALSMPSPTPLVPLLSYKDQMTSCGWDFRSHAPQKRILTLCILAAASLVSVEPSYVGYDPSGGRFSAAHLKWDAVSSAPLGSPQMGELGARRKLLSARLYGEAVRQAHQDGITSFASIENATSCFLLNVLDVTYTPNSTHPWAAAAVWQLRTLSELGVIEAVCQLPDVSSRDTSCLQWRGFLSLLAVYAMNAGKSLPFSTYDELLICGPSPASLDQMFSQAEHIPVVQLRAEPAWILIGV